MTASNPFATRFIRPGALGFLFEPGQSAEWLVENLRASGWQGQIVGPHGSGKSTLVAALVPALEGAGRTIERYAVRSGQALVIAPESIARWTTGTQVIVDGYEQLSWLARRKLQSQVRAHQAGLLVTTHADMGLPTLYQTQPTEELARSIVAALLKDESAAITADDIRAAYAAHHPNLREMLFALYDIYQARRK
jgi:energy-coupling factor transporter ATP-binding protein EcfA2